MLKTMKLNCRYIFVTSNKIATVLFSLWGFITLVTPTDMMLNCIKNVALRMLVAAFILMIIYVVIVLGVTNYAKRTRKIKIFDLHSKHSLYVEYGDLFNSGDPDEKKNIAFAGNRCFDTVVDDDLVGTRKIHGIALNRLYESKSRNQSDIHEEIQKNLSLHGYSSTELCREEKRSGNLKRYEVGTVAEIKGLQNERYFILGLTYFDSELRARVEKSDYIIAICSLVKYISDRSQEFPTYMPVIGAGGADAGNVKDLVVFIINTIEIFKNEIDCDVHIVISDKEERIGLLNLKMI